MKYPGLIAELGRLCKQASLGVSYPQPRPAETPAQARRATGRPNNFSTGGVFQQAAPQQEAQAVPQPPQQPGQAGRLPQVDTIR